MRRLLVPVVIWMHTAVPHAAECPHHLVAEETMRRVIESIRGYDVTAVTNQSRFVADFLLRLAGRPEVRAAGETFQLLPERFFSAWLAATGSRPEDAPASMRKVLEINQRFVVDMQPEIELALPQGLDPPRMLAVYVSWPTGPGQPASYTYEDTLSDPHVRLRHERVITYQLLAFDEFIAYENMTGIAARPTSGALGALFALLGMTDILSSRFAIARDGTQVNRSRVRKLFTFTARTTISPDGTARRGIPDGREDLEALAEKLNVDLEVEMSSPWPAPCD